LSRLFENFGDDADEAELPIVPLPEADVLHDGLYDDGGSSSLLDDVPFGEPLALAEEAPAVVAPEEPDEDEIAASLSPLGYEIPDFEKDEREVAAYEDAERRHIRQAISNGETAIHASFKAKREQLTRELKASRSFEEERRASAMHTTRQYANAFPHHVDKRGVNPPGFWENLFSFGRAGRLYREASIATEALEQLRTGMRKREEQLGALESQMSRALYLKEESIKKAMETDAGRAEFHARPEIAGLYKRVEKIKKERETYAKRLERGEVSSEEQRDRAISEHKLTLAALPLMGAIIAKVARFGELSYFQLRDLEKKESLLSYDPRLDPLRNSVFDVYAVAGTVAAKLKRNDNGTAFRVADHFKVCWRNQEKAEELYAQHRAALREDRGLPAMPPRDEAEAEIVERLAALAAMVDGGQARDQTHAATGSSAAPTLHK
jgi:hypothetical protein